MPSAFLLWANWAIESVREAEESSGPEAGEGNAKK